MIDTKMINGKAHWQCGICEDVAELKTPATDTWIYENLNFNNRTMKFFCCPKCQKLSPEELSNKAVRFEVTDET